MRPQNKPKPDVIDNANNFRLCKHCDDEFVDLSQNWRFRSKVFNTGKCKMCDNAYHREHYKKIKARTAARMKKWREDNPDYHKNYNKTYIRKEKLI